MCGELSRSLVGQSWLLLEEGRSHALDLDPDEVFHARGADRAPIDRVRDERWRDAARLGDIQLSDARLLQELLDLPGGALPDRSHGMTLHHLGEPQNNYLCHKMQPSSVPT